MNEHYQHRGPWSAVRQIVTVLLNMTGLLTLATSY